VYRRRVDFAELFDATNEEHHYHGQRVLFVLDFLAFRGFRGIFYGPQRVVHEGERRRRVQTKCNLQAQVKCVKGK
jgi:hypothetical protein